MGFCPSELFPLGKAAEPHQPGSALLSLPPLNLPLPEAVLRVAARLQGFGPLPESVTTREWVSIHGGRCSPGLFPLQDSPSPRDEPGFPSPPLLRNSPHPFRAG